MEEFNTKVKNFADNILNEKVKDKLKEDLDEHQIKIFVASLYEIVLVEYKGELANNKEKINFTTFKTLDELGKSSKLNSNLK